MVKPHAAPQSTQPSLKGGTSSTQETEESGVAQSQFVAFALTLSWQLALVVLIPIVGGYELDQATSSSPLWTLVGFGLAATGFALILWRIVQQVNKEQAKRKDS